MQTIYLAVIIILLLVLIYYRAERRAERSRAWAVWTATLHDYLTAPPALQAYYGDQLRTRAPAPQLPSVAAALGEIRTAFDARDAKRAGAKIDQLYTAAEAWATRDGQLVDTYLDSLVAIIAAAAADKAHELLAARDAALRSAASLGALAV